MQTFDCNLRQKEWNCVPGMYLRQPLILLALVVLLCHINLQTCRTESPTFKLRTECMILWEQHLKSLQTLQYHPHQERTKISSSDGGSQMCKSLWTMAQYKLHHVCNRSHPQIKGNHEILGELGAPMSSSGMRMYQVNYRFRSQQLKGVKDLNISSLPIPKSNILLIFEPCKYLYQVQ